MKLSLQAYCRHSQVCVKNVPSGLNFRAVFGPKYGQNRSINRFSSIVLKRFCYMHLKLDLQAHWSYFCRCVKDRPQKPPNESKFRFLNILLKSLLWIHISLALYAYWSYFQRCTKFGPQRPNLWAILGPKVSQISGVWSLSQKVFHWFHNSIDLHARCKYF